MAEDISNLKEWQKKIHRVIFGYTSFEGKLFDVVLLVAILASVFVVMLESVKQINEFLGNELRVVEWVFTILFSLEYIARILSSPKPMKYVLSFMGIVDLLSLIPTFLSLFIDGAHALLVIRSIRLIRIFRILKLTRYLGGAQQLGDALWQSRYKIIVFLGSVLCIVVIIGTLMYMIESDDSGFTSIPRSIYWAVVTITTVGYGDIAPQTVMGQFVATMLMIIGYAIIAVPTGIVTQQMIKSEKNLTVSCMSCGELNLPKESKFCLSCGEPVIRNSDG